MHGNQIIHTLLVGMETGSITLGNNLTASYKAKHTTTMPPSSGTPEHVSWEWKLPFTNVYMNVHSSFVCNNSTLERTQMSLNG